jgi:hypothetical protein
MSTPDIAAVRRRRWVNDPESLLLSASPVADLEATVQAARFFGADPGGLLMSRMCTVPLLLPETPRPVKRRFPDGVQAEALWHPLLWLPDSVSGRRTVPGDGRDGPRPEFDDAYAIRIAVTLMGAALYDPSDGTWADVLSLAGIDTDQEDHLARVRAWLGGGSDPALDAIDLSPYITPAAEELGALLAGEENDMILAGMHRSARDLAGVIDGAVNPVTGQLADGADEQEASFALHLCALAAMYAFASLGDPETAEWRVDAARAVKADTTPALAGLAGEMRARLTGIARETAGAFGAAVTMLAGFDAPGQDEPPAG